MRSGWLIALMWLAAALSTTAWADNKADFLAAREALQKGDLNMVAAKAEALSRDPLGIYPRYWLLSQQIERVTPEQIQPFLAFYQGSWLAEKLRGDWLRSLGRRGDWLRFREQYAQLSEDPGAELNCYQFRARLDNKDPKALSQARAQLWFSAKDLPTDACDPLMAELIRSGVVSEDDIRERLRLALEANAPGLARFLAGQLGQELKAADLQRMVNTPDAWLKKPGNSGRLQQELAVFAMARLARTDVDAAYAQFQNWRARLDDEVQVYGLRRLATIAAFRHDLRALEWFAHTDDSKLAWTDTALEWRIRLALRAEDWDAVSTSIRLLSDEKQNERGWQYWLGRALEAKKSSAEASKLFAGLSIDDDFYGLLARDRLGPVIGPGKTVYKVTDEDARRVAASAGLQRALLLNQMELRTEATREWNWALRGMDDRFLLAAAEAANQAMWYDRAIYAAERTKALHNYELRYVAPYREVTRGYAREMGLDEAWVFGLMRQESRFVSAARSGVGAGGLMQLMPATAQWVANRMGLKYHASMVSDAGTNVKLGTFYLKHVMDVLSNQPVLATAAYNAGPNRARSWQPDGKPMEAAIYIESIPFSETRDYEKKVMTNAAHYAMAFGQGRQSFTARIGSIPPRNPQAIEGP
ncbi:MAG: transglycosylase SLT domain-containing protein [bacterium]|nr:transglycosylase SLT domain-containing protein [bacterium]